MNLLAIAAFWSSCLAAVFGALWWAERDRRIAAERWLQFGGPDLPRARVRAPDPDPETRVRTLDRELAQQSQDARYDLERATASIMAAATDVGRRITPEEARAEAEAMIHELLESGGQAW